MGSHKFENAKRAWSKAGVEKAVTIILKESNLLFESMVKQLDTYEELYRIMEDILYCGKRIPFSLEEKSIKEAQTRDERRTDVIVDYCGEQFIVELKIWHGNEYNERGERQLTEYLDYYHKDKGYMLSFNFNKNKVIGVKEVKVKDKTIVEAVV